MISSKKVTPLDNYENLEYCLICNKELTIRNSVTPLCKHTHCYECFWKWAEKNDTCPFCRSKLIPRNREKELEIQNLIERRGEIRVSLENLYNEYDIKKAHFNAINKKIKYLHNQKKNLNIMICELEYKYGYIKKKKKYKFKFFNKLHSWKNNPLLGLKYFKNSYKLKMKLNLNICFQEIKYNIKRKHIRFWKNLNKKWKGQFLYKEKENNEFKKIFSNFHIYRKLKKRSYFNQKYTVLPTSSFSTSLINFENMEDDEEYDYNSVVEI